MKLTLQELADLTGGKIVRSGAVSEFGNMGALDEAEQTDVSFLGNEKYHQDYFRLNPNAGYCSYVIAPKVKKLEKAFRVTRDMIARMDCWYWARSRVSL